MHSDFPAVLDACVLANGRLCDLYLRLAESPRLYLPIWSIQILEEVRRTQTTKLKHPYSLSLAAYWREEVQKAFPASTVEGWENFMSLAKNQEKDRHVLAAAIAAKASLIITFNLRDFPATALSPHGVEAQSPQDHLLTLWSIEPAIVMSKLALMAKDRDEDLEDLLIALGRSVPEFSRHVLKFAGLI